MSIAPLGAPVVPEVYMMNAVASSGTASSRWVGSAAARTSSRSPPMVIVRRTAGAPSRAAAMRSAVAVSATATTAPESVQGVRDLVGHQPEVDRHADRARAQHGDVGLEQVDTVETQHRDPIAGCDALADQGGRPVG